MPSITLTNALRAEYTALFNSCVIRPNRTRTVETLVDKLLSNRARYEAAGNPLGIPWHFIAVIHNMESSQSFRGHLHNGDPLTARTVQEPPGRPRTGNPPFTWEVSAADALTMKGLGARTEWSLPGTLFQLERYNGFGYRLSHPDVLTPYLWSFSNHYTAGKFVADHVFSDTAVSEQCGAATLLRRMAERNLFAFADQPAPADNTPPLVVPFATSKPTDPTILAQAITLQNWLTTHTGIFLKPDGIAGKNTSDAFRAVTGRFLPGDPRGS